MVRQMDKATNNGTLAKAKETAQNALETSAELCTQGTVEVLQTELIESCSSCDNLLKAWQQEQQKHSMVLAQYEEIKLSFAEAEERAQETKAVLEQEQQKYSTYLAHFEGIKNALQQENNELRNSIDTLQDSVEKLEVELCETQRARHQEQQKHSMVLAQYEEFKNTLKYENNKLRDHVNTLQDSVEKLEVELCETQRAWQQEQQKHSMVLAQYEEFKMLWGSFLANLWSLTFQLSLAEAEEKAQETKAVLEQEQEESSAYLAQYEETENTLQHEKIDQRDHGKTPQDLTEKLEVEPCGTQSMSEELQNESSAARAALCDEIKLCLAEPEERAQETKAVLEQKQQKNSPFGQV
ncbi:involucrin-like [Neoarius graeffei]|uniref:involucrin-like n=1 Tax=Neoarius graeffei TaxID=443677 RepID=UPI00298C30B3|nr:involucrin-like [Neoarius graeffei]